MSFIASFGEATYIVRRSEDRQLWTPYFRNKGVKWAGLLRIVKILRVIWLYIEPVSQDLQHIYKFSIYLKVLALLITHSVNSCIWGIIIPVNYNKAGTVLLTYSSHPPAPITAVKLYWGDFMQAFQNLSLIGTFNIYIIHEVVT